MTVIDGQGDLLALLEQEHDGVVEFRCFECGHVWHTRRAPELWVKDEQLHLNGRTSSDNAPMGCINSRRAVENVAGVQGRHCDPLPGMQAAWVRTYVLMRWKIAWLRGHPEAQKHIQTLEAWLDWWDRSWFVGTPEQKQRLQLEAAGHDFSKEKRDR